MSINGVLEDLALADVLQFVHLGRRTGTLYMWQDDEQRAEIGFHDGRIVSAWTPRQKKLGDLLVTAGVLTAESLESALLHQRTTGEGQSLGQILLRRGEVTRDDIHRVIREQVEVTIFDLVTWQKGNFHFEVDELHPVDGIGLAPGELLDDLDLNTQMLLLEATRIFDERHRQEAAEPADGSTNVLDKRLKRAGLGRPPGPEGAPARERPAPDDERPRRESSAGLETLRCQVVTADSTLVETLHKGLPSELARVVSVRLREAGTRMPGESASPVVVLDLRMKGREPEDIATLGRTRPTASVVALVGSPGEAAAAYRSGALAVVEAADGSLVDCCRNLIRVFSHPQPQGTFGYGRGGFSRFRQVVFDVQSGLLSVTMALNLMNVISESVERAVLFLVQGDELTAVGAFGFSETGEPLAKLSRGFKVRIGGEGALRRAIDEAKPQSVELAAAGLPPALVEMLGEPASGQAVIFPVLGAERAISVIYTDNGELEQEIHDIKILELATSQVGVAFENELLRQQLGSGELVLE